MSEEEMGLIENLAEQILTNLNFNNIKEVKRFCQELQIEIVGLYDPDFCCSESESESEDDDVGEAETIKVSVDNDGFMKIE
tara:strand:- start:204 stop:446 length:243 start_codon:yes stop_codon:yes gene_type:complete